MGQDVIAAIITGLVPSGVGIIRISGEEAVSVCENVVRIRNKRLSETESNHVYYGFIYDGETRLDEALIIVMRAPHSFTAENTVEIQCHGGPHILQRILETVIRAGARLAEPGEFSKRAFLNGRLDLSEAEAIMDLIQAENEFARETALNQLRGVPSGLVKELRAVILEETAHIEAALDDPEHMSLEGYPEHLMPVLRDTEQKIRELIDSSENGRRLAEGISTAIVGRPNVGKSSLLNALLGEERAIVTDIAGTTRDTIEEKLRLGDMILNLADTAGIRSSGDVIEQLGMERAFRKAEQSELILFVIDGSRELEDEDQKILNRIRGKRSLILVNKSDLGLVLDPEKLEQESGIRVIPISAKRGEGIRELEETISELFHFGEIRQKPVVFTNVRHKELLSEALRSVLQAKETLEAGLPEDFLSVDLMDAYRSLGLILGEAVEDDLVGEIFRKFCMGK